MITGGRKTCKQIVGHFDNGPMQEDQWFSLFCASFTPWIVQPSIMYFCCARGARVCGACLPWVPAGLACSGARLPSDVCTTRGTVPLTMVTAQHDRIPSQTFQHFWTFEYCKLPKWEDLEWPALTIARSSGSPDWNSAWRNQRHRLVYEHQVAWAGLGLHFVRDIFWSGKAQAFVVQALGHALPALMALPSRGMCTWTCVSWSLPRASLSL